MTITKHRKPVLILFFFFNDTATTEIYTLSLHDALPILLAERRRRRERWGVSGLAGAAALAGLLVFRPFWTKPVDAAELARVKQQSATLEQQLGRYDPDGRVTSGRSAALAAALEDRIAVIDGELAQLGPSQAQAHSADLVNLWQQRVDLMEQLMSVRVTRAAYVGL